MKILNLALLFVFSSFTFGEEQKVIIADTIDWEGYPTFFIDANLSMIDKVRLQIIEDIKSNKLECTNKSSVNWLCDTTKLRYFSGVSGTDMSLKSGWICNSAGIPKQEYYAERTFFISQCVEYWWDEEYELLVA